MARFICQNLYRRLHEDPGQFYAPLSSYDCHKANDPVEFEAKCFFHALSVIWPWIERSWDWNFERDHEENDEKSRVFRFQDEEETFKITRVD